MSYGTIAEADAYLGSPWIDLSSEDKQRHLDRSEAYLDNLCWQGALTIVTQTIAWPRTGVIDKEGRTVDPDTIPQDIISAFFECASIDSLGGLYVTEEAGLTSKTVTAGSVSVSKDYANPTDSTPAHGNWVDNLISQYECPDQNDYLLRA